MAKQVINTGSVANDGTGDTLRAAFTKTNANFTELYNSVADTDFPQGAYTKANSSFLQANGAFTQSNSAFLQANSAYNQANTGTTLAQAAFNFANTIISDTQVDPYARTTANTNATNITLLQGVDVTQNTNITNVTNTSTAGFIHANSAYQSQNTTGSYANAAFLQANTPSHVANSAALYANGAFNQSNTATTNAATADSKAVTAGSYANSAFNQANTATTNAETADSKAVSAGSYANSAYTQANTAATLAQSAFNAANTTPTGIANSSYSLKLNDSGILSLDYNNTTDLRLNSSGLTSYGQFSIESANSTSGNNSTILFDRNGSGIAFRLEDNTPVSKNWGFYQTNVLFPDTTRQYTAFTGYATDNTARTTANSGFLQANTATTNALAASTYANSAYSQANTSTSDASTADSKAVTAGSYANSAYTQANTATTNALAASTYANSAYARANTSLNVASGGTITGDVSITDGYLTTNVATATLSSTASSAGYLGIPQSATSTTATLAIGDAGKHIYVTTDGQTITIPANASVAYPIGTTIGFIAGPNATTVTIAITSDTMYLGGTGTTGSRTLAAYGMATAVKVADTTWYISGYGLT
jgi:hypothetical protein